MRIIILELDPIAKKGEDDDLRCVPTPLSASSSPTSALATPAISLYPPSRARGVDSSLDNAGWLYSSMVKPHGTHMVQLYPGDY